MSLLYIVRKLQRLFIFELHQKNYFNLVKIWFCLKIKHLFNNFNSNSSSSDKETKIIKMNNYSVKCFM